MTGSGPLWRPTATPQALRRRAAMLRKVRAFFFERGVLEVETPLLSAETALDPHIESVPARIEAPGLKSRRMYLQTSPELAMKRLLAAGSGSIYQICKAFRGGERGRWHNPEFTILEWYRVGWDVDRLMGEVADLIEAMLAGSRPLAPPVRATFADLLRQHADIDPLRTPTRVLRQAVERATSLENTSGLDRDDLLSRLFGELVEPAFEPDRVTLVHGYPASQAAMARLNPDDPRTAERFEAYVGAVELANGYGELVDADEQRQRLVSDRQTRQQRGQAVPPIPARFLAALENGVPPCAGVALGLDRLLGLDLAARSIDELIAFPIERA